MLINETDLLKTRRENLKKLINKFENQKAFALSLKLNEAHVSQMKRGVREIGEKIARKIEIEAGLSPGWIDKNHDSSNFLITEPPDYYEKSKIIAIPQYRNHSLSAGPGSIAEDEKPGSEMYFKNSWLKHKGWKEKDLFVIYVKGTSMEPVLSDGDVVLINSSDKLITSGQIYAINTYGETKIKRIFRQINGSLLIKSENIDFPEETMPAEDVENLIILGRAVWVGKELF